MTDTTQVPVPSDLPFSMACPTREDTPFFNHCMRLAKDRGLKWDEALQYTIKLRREF